MRYRDPDTGRFISYETWVELQKETMEEFDDWEYLDWDWDFGEEEY